MKLLDPRAPLFFAAAALLGLAVFLAVYHPTPGHLSRAHDRVPGLEVLPGCPECHSSAGLDKGCLSCHGEIASQVASGKGFHGKLPEGKTALCAACHPEHLGPDFPLVSSLSWEGRDPKAFDHSHVRYVLEGKHRGLSCESCHGRKGGKGILPGKPFALERFQALARETTYLGETQDCRACHEDIHSGGLSGPCEACHGQEAFRPASGFDHGKFFPLAGAHEKTPCAGCHLIPERPAGSEAAAVLPFDKVRGKTCIECHPTPHRDPGWKDCTSCHPGTAQAWAAGAAKVTPEIHAGAGFVLKGAHAAVACAKCHPAGRPYAERFPDPRTPGYGRREADCAGCHKDPHKGQFAAKHPECQDCHTVERFAPSLFAAKDHTIYPLEGGHAKVECTACHLPGADGMRLYAGLGRECASCHKDPHKGQFAAKGRKCEDCHGTDRFTPARFSLKDHSSYPLEGAHGAVACRSCHLEDAPGGTRLFVGLTRACQDCHKDPHGGQFGRELAKGDCDACHRAGGPDFRIRPYDHAARTGYALVGSHAKAACGDCHGVFRPAAAPAPVPAAGRKVEEVRLYRPMDARCVGCHQDIHRGQFASQGANPCEGCHGPGSAWKPVRFDHNRQSRFALDGTHVKVPCASCHPTVKLPGGELVQYKPIGTECKDCHAFQNR